MLKPLRTRSPPAILSSPEYNYLSIVDTKCYSYATYSSVHFEVDIKYERLLTEGKMEHFRIIP